MDAGVFLQVFLGKKYIFPSLTWIGEDHLSDEATILVAWTWASTGG